MGIYSVLGVIGVVLIKIGRLFYTHRRNYGWINQNMENA
jgi:hypothetical protein